MSGTLDKILVDIVIPVYNEQVALADSVHKLRAYLLENFPYTWRITIADNASTDQTWTIAQDLMANVPGVRAVHLDRKGRGRALRQTWLESEAEVACYMDVDLSTGLEGLLPLVAPIISGQSEISIGSRLAHGAMVARQPKREIISRCYNLLIKGTFFNHFSDAQCGFKAIRTSTARLLLPLVKNNEWFFDTELLLLAEHNGLAVYEVPVRWVEDLDSRVKIAKTVAEDLRGLWRMRRTFWLGEGRVANMPTDLLETLPKADRRDHSVVLTQ